MSQLRIKLKRRTGIRFCAVTRRIAKTRFIELAHSGFGWGLRFLRCGSLHTPRYKPSLPTSDDEEAARLAACPSLHTPTRAFCILRLALLRHTPRYRRYILRCPTPARASDPLFATLSRLYPLQKQNPMVASTFILG